MRSTIWWVQTAGIAATGLAPRRCSRRSARSRSRFPGDTELTFEPQIVKKRQRRLTGVDEIVLSLSGQIKLALCAMRRFGGFKGSSQRLARGGCDGREAEKVGSGRSSVDAFAGGPRVARREHRQGFWAAIACGLSSEDASVEAGVSIPVGVRWFREGGGMPPTNQAPLSGRYLSFVEREEIAMLRARGCGVREIARLVGRSPSTISRELRRNAATRSGSFEYRATTAQWHADLRAKRPKTAKLAGKPELQRYVQTRLAGVIERPDRSSVSGPDVRWEGRRHGRRQDRRWAKAWSPEQISNRLRLDFPDDESMRISHEAIYQSLYVQGRGALRRELTACLRSGRALRVPRARVRGRGKHFVSKEILISERPAEAADRAVPGH
jgi:hypothetical protein